MLFAPSIGRMVALLAGIHGAVRSAGDVAPVIGVHVEIDGTDRTTTDSAGRYVVGGLATGTHQLRFISVGYETRQLTVLLTDSSELAVDVDLTPRPVILPPLAVVARGADDQARTDAFWSTDWDEAGHYRFGPGWQANQPAGSVDIADALARASGVATRGDNTTALSVHGARGSENLTLLDGIPLFGAVHFAGASSAVNPDAVAAMDLHAGVSSARFGGALSGVVELETAEALSGGQITGDLSTADVRSMARASFGTSGGVLLSARSSIRDLMTDGTDLGSVNGYQDFLAAGSTTIGTGVVRLLGFESANRLRWEPVVSGLLRAADPTTPAPLAPSNAADWQSGAIGVTWTQPVGRDGEWHAAGWWSGNSATIATLSSGRTDQLASGIGELGVSTDWSQRFRTGTVSFGGEFTRPQTWYTSGTLFTQPGSDLTGVALAAVPVLGAVYGEWDWHGASRLDFRVGVRGNTDFRQSVSVDPRVLVNFHPDAVTRIEAGFGRMHQFLQSMLNEDNLMSAVIGPSLLTSPAGGQPPASSDQWVVSAERRVAPGISVSLDGYVRSWQNVLAPALTSSGLYVATTPAYGDGDARGVNASVSIVRGHVTAQVSAGLASSVQRVDGVTYPSSFDQPWSLSGDVSYQLPARTSIQLRWNAGAGQPATAILSGIEWSSYQPATGIGEIEGTATNAAGAINALRLPGPMRLDLGVRREWHFSGNNHGNGITTAVRMENLFNQANPIGMIAQSDGTLQLLRGTPRGLVFEVGWAH
jgi:hypothetical protein